VSNHCLKIDVQEVAHCIKRIHVELALIDHIFQKSLMEECNGKADGERKEGEKNKSHD